MTKPRPTDSKALERAEAEAAAAAADEAAAIAPAAEAAPVAPEPAVAPAGPEPAVARDDVDDGPTSADYSIAFSPRNVAVGLAIVAGLVAFAARRRRRKGDAGRRDG